MTHHNFGLLPNIEASFLPTLATRGTTLAMSKDHDEHLATTWRQDLSIAGEADRQPSNSQHQIASTRFAGELSRQVIVQYLEEALRIIYDDDDDDDEDVEELRQEDDTSVVPPSSLSSADA